MSKDMTTKPEPEKPVCDVCDDKGYIDVGVHANWPGTNYSLKPVGSRVVCWKCREKES